MAKTKKISINAMDKVVKSSHTPFTEIEWNGLNVTVKYTLTFKEMLEFVDSVTKTCFTSSTNTYMPEAKGFAIKSNILEKYTNFTLPNNLEHRYEMIYCTNIIDTVLEHINTQQYSEIINAIDDKIENIAQANIEYMNKQFAELYTAFENFQKHTEEMFNGINSDKVMDVMKTLINDGLDETKLVNAYMLHNKGNADA